MIMMVDMFPVEKRRVEMMMMMMMTISHWQLWAGRNSL